jgi:hypothetical protein
LFPGERGTRTRAVENSVGLPCWWFAKIARAPDGGK